MSTQTREIRVAEGPDAIPPLRLPPQAHGQGDPKFEPPSPSMPPAIEPIEHTIRSKILQNPVPGDNLLRHYTWHPGKDPEQTPWKDERKRKPEVVKQIEEAIEDRRRKDMQFFENPGDDGLLSQAPVFLRRAIRDARSSDNAAAALAEERENRDNWYDLIPASNIYHVFRTSKLGSYRDTTMFGFEMDITVRGVVAVTKGGDWDQKIAQDDSIDHRYVSNLFDWDPDTAPCRLEDYGLEPPAPLLVFDHDGSVKPLVPYTGGLTCTCPYKQGQPFRVLCKHEAALLYRMKQNQSIELTRDYGNPVPARARRLVRPADIPAEWYEM